MSSGRCGEWCLRPPEGAITSWCSRRCTVQLQLLASLNSSFMQVQRNASCLSGAARPREDPCDGAEWWDRGAQSARSPVAKSVWLARSVSAFCPIWARPDCAQYYRCAGARPRCGLPRGRAGRFMHSSPASGRERVFRPPFHRVCPSGKSNRNAINRRICPSGKVQLWHLVKVARVVGGKNTKAESWPQELKVNIPSGYDNVNLIWSSRG